MGMFTEVEHQGNVYQIKTGCDSLDRYRIWDTVRWSISEDYPGSGTLLDGAYLGLGEEDDAWVIIKDHKIHAIIPCSLSESENEWETSQQYLETFDLKPFERDWWPEELWEKQRLKEEARSKAHKERISKELARLGIAEGERVPVHVYLKALYSTDDIHRMFYENNPLFELKPNKS